MGINSNRTIQMIIKSFWMPYVGSFCIFLSYIILSHGVRHAETNLILVPNYFIVFVSLLGSGVIVLSLYLFLSIKYKLKACIYNIIVCFFVVSCFFIVIEKYVFRKANRFKEYSEYQNSLQGLINRRNTTSSTFFRGITEKVSSNDFGWADKKRKFLKTKRRIVLIGDSFLEVRSNKNIATLLEEKLNNHNREVEVINLSKDDVPPDPFYRNVFYQFAFDYKPDMVLMFLYGGNDLLLNYKYKPYEHQMFSISNDAKNKIREILNDKNIDSEIKEIIKNRIVFNNKEVFVNRFNKRGLKYEDIMQCYEITLAYSNYSNHTNPYKNPFFDLLPNTTMKYEDIYGIIKGDDGKGGKTITKTRKDWRDSWDKYEGIFNHKKEIRLGMIARYIATEYYRNEDYEKIFNILNQQGDDFVNELIAQADMNYYLLPAVDDAMRNGKKVIIDKALHKIINDGVEEHVKLLTEMNEYSKMHNAQFIAVLIPEASRIDSSFINFWKGLTSFDGLFLINHVMSSKLSDKLEKSGIQIIDLNKYPDELNDAYWKFDGHFNPNGNQKVSDIIVKHLN